MVVRVAVHFRTILGERVTKEKATVDGKLPRGSNLRCCHDPAVGERAVQLPDERHWSAARLSV
jgi:hypothetical protein